MSVVEAVKRIVGKKRLHDARVDERDHGAVVSGEVQGGLSDESQGGEARPAVAGEELDVVAGLVPRHSGCTTWSASSPSVPGWPRCLRSTWCRDRSPTRLWSGRDAS